jgi:D-serine deaminase-like pyridoxal phosphate-dependent protein
MMASLVSWRMKNIQRPVLVVDEARCRANIREMHAKAIHASARFRPHFKTHQSVEIGNWFRDEGVSAIAVSSVSMAEVFAGDGWKDIMIAFPVNFREMDRINALAERLNLGLLVSCPQSAGMLVGTLKYPADVYLKIDVGSHRTGFDPDSPGVISDSLSLLSGDRNLRLSGFVAHAGHTYQAGSSDEILRICSESTRMLQSLKKDFAAGYPGMVISWGDTPSCWLAAEFNAVDELRPGNFVFFDTMQLDLGVCTREQLALSVSASVVSLHPERGEVVVYAGAVHLSKEQGLGRDGHVHYGRVVFYDANGYIEWPEEDIFVRRLSQEHGIISMPGRVIGKLSPGDLLGIVPVHSCLAADLVREYHVV